MYPLFETIFVSRGRPLYPGYHWERMKHTVESLWGKKLLFSPDILASLPIPADINKVYRCRLEYDAASHRMRMEEYHYQPIKTLKLVQAGQLMYRYKFTDRSGFDELFALRDACDDILIVQDGYVTDTSMANIIFTDGHKLFTPSTPLLAGTARARLLGEGLIFEKAIRTCELGNYSGFALINALRVHFLPDFQPIINIRL